MQNEPKSGPDLSGLIGSAPTPLLSRNSRPFQVEQVTKTLILKLFWM